ncbi:SEC-C motif-containing protein [Desulfofundulus australicus DSM 11792]|uniref:SEC-C motif-containing protein n=1 Tax=Desulfofundulus australicus DSM 11792 TaxID=1121425 RepID=A0A1M5DG45_9FIRM|nr:SEC-C metal-binding domain-containing protein [Desulfofundulus australicus]SHF65886.1 SEC-C motif-containing protein [Desulfofundulus australicus DSM 11792]
MYTVEDIAARSDCITVRYRRPRGGKRKDFYLVMNYLNGTEVRFVLAAELGKAGWRVLHAVIDDESDMAEEAARDFASLHWHIFPQRRDRYVLPPVVAVWDVEGLTVAACIPPEWGGRFLPCARQRQWFTFGDRLPDPGRALCWWPSPAVWDRWREAGRYLGRKRFSAPAVIPFFTFSQWVRRADVKRAFDEKREAMRQFEGGRYGEEFRGLHDEIVAEDIAEGYARYVRGVRTALAFLRKRGIPVRVVLGDTARAQEFFSENGCDPGDPASWGNAAAVFPEMPDCVVEEYNYSGPLGAAVGAGKLRAAVSGYSHWPNSPAVDFIGASIYSGNRHLIDIACWLNPIKVDSPAAFEKLYSTFRGELARRGVKDVVFSDTIFPFRVWPHNRELALLAPGDWFGKPKRKTGWNDPCPCGSGLKYKNCCGAL